MNAVGIDVSKGKSTVTIHGAGNVVLMPSRNIPHTYSCLLYCNVYQLNVSTFLI